MAKEQTMMIDPKSGFCSETKIYHSLLPPAPLPPSTTSMSISDYVLSLLHQHYTSSTSDFYPERVTAFIESETGDRLSYSEFLRKIESLTHSMKSVIGLSKGDTAFILSPATPQIPVLYLSLLSIGVIVSPSNPISTATEISHQINLCKPAIAFGTSETTHKLPSVLRFPTIMLDSQDFHSLMHCSSIRQNQMDSEEEKISQSDTAAILYSSGTTGRVKGVTLSHRNLIASVGEVYAYKQMLKISTRAVNYSTVPLFHIYGFTAILESVTMADTFVIPMKRFDFCGMLKAIEKFKVTVLAAAPPVILAMTKCQSATASGGILDGYDLSSVEGIRCGGSPLRTEVIVKFGKQCHKAADAWDCRQLGSTGKLVANMQVKIVDPATGVALPPCKQGELWAKGPSIMKGYLGEGAQGIPPAIDSEGWLKTGDLCYVDNEGFLYVVDRLKELIKYKGYQVPPAELEELLLSHPDILDAAVIPYPDEEAGEVPMAFVVRKPQASIEKTQVIDFISKQVAPYKKIRRVEFIDSIPKNAPGKILRKELKTRALSKMLATTSKL
ncbi:4-coumarate--CoA ligase-like 9 [Papaver somniferum]|nr:4-coumarate--CoA ligase-like 9 [Papaver somniferum]XP_026447855.1 4-coumarate--CoA ligase-like 9 [Papaver somniferum]